jgi:hypothetical protein
MSQRNAVWQERRLEEILFSSTDPVSKVQQIIRLGFDPEVADEIVERHQTGTQAPAYYESLDFADLDDDPEQDVELLETESATDSEMDDREESSGGDIKTG